jgi:ubiquitin carboxyl-terminal hydrolase BAP1
MAAAGGRGNGGGNKTTKASVNLSTEWLELESDPGLFTLLIQDFGVSGIKVEEIYDVTQTFDDCKVYGFVFLFQWIEERRSRKKSSLNDECYVTEPLIIQNMFFAHQIVVNSCATHALLSILLNIDLENDESVDLGCTLPSLKQFCRHLDPEMRGYAIGNMPDLASAHNHYAKPDLSLPAPPPSKRSTFVPSSYAPETFHFVSYVPIGERLFELDGLKDWPIDHGPWAETESWIDLFKRVISKRLNEGDSIQYNLMALITDPLPKLSRHMKQLQTKEKELLDSIYDLAKEKIEREKLNGEMKCTIDIDEDIRLLLESLANISMDDKESVTSDGLDVRLQLAISNIRSNKAALEEAKKKFEDEMEVRKKYKIDAERRTHDYDSFFVEYFKALSAHHLLPEEHNRQNSSSVGSKRGGKKLSNTTRKKKSKAYNY